MTVASRTGDDLYLIVLNQDATDAVTSAVQLSGYTASSADVWTLNSDKLEDINTNDKPNTVHIDTSKLTINSDSFNYTYPAHSLTAFKFTKQTSVGKKSHSSSGGSAVSVTPTPEGTTEPAVKPAPTAPEKVPAPEGKGTAAFADLTNHWAEANISELIASGVIDGYPDRTFQPDKSVTRAEFVKLLLTAFRLDVKPADVAGYADSAKHWAKDYIAAAQAQGIASGYDAKTFGPDDLITREQMAAMIVKAAKLADVQTTHSFTDQSSVSDWAKAAIATAKDKAIINGYPDGSFKPQGHATRAEAVTVIVKALKLKK